MMPYRIMKAATLVTSFCCSDTTVEVVYTMVKLYPIIMPVTCFALSKDFRRVRDVQIRINDTQYLGGTSGRVEPHFI